jgi:hypothetical protein
VTNEVRRCLADLDRRFFGFLWQKFVIQLRHLAVGADIIRLETLFKVGVLVHQWADGRAIGLHYISTHRLDSSSYKWQFTYQDRQVLSSRFPQIPRSSTMRAL